ncbi:MAG TPA: hypothetical protein VGH16_11850, partial [Candidatus Binatia bacterium]
AFPGAAPAARAAGTPELPLWFRISFWGALVIIPILALWLAGRDWFGAAIVPNNKSPFEITALLTFLGFVVAVASYLAAVGREIVKKIGDADKGSKDWKNYKVNIGYVAVSELNLLLLGIAIFARIVTGPDKWNFGIVSVFPDALLVAYLAAIIGALILNHLRVIFCIYKPWSAKAAPKS